MKKTPVFNEIMIEQNQHHETRKTVLSKIEKLIDRPVVSYFTSFIHPVMIDDSDSTMIEEVLRNLDLSNGLALIINSPGGDGLAAERIINACKKYSKTNEFWAIVPDKAKSAATMVCFGASKILMSETSELGPIDPQIALMTGNSYQRFSLFNIVQEYDDLFKRATQETGNLQPYLQQLQNYDSKVIKEYRSAIELAEDIAIRALKTGMLSEINEDEIKEKIKHFVNPEKAKTHGRPIYISDALNAGLKVETHALDSELWNLVYEVSFRTSNFVNSHASKCVESREMSYARPISTSE